MQSIKDELNINSESEISEITKKVLDMSVDFQKDHEGPVFLALQGDLGSGKTTFTKSLAKELGIGEHIMSPTFVIFKKYEIPNESQFADSFKELIHIDAYRLNNSEELIKLGIKNFIESSSLICLEWPELVPEILPQSYIKVNFEHLFDNTNTEKRKVTVEVKV